jgi:hypothetical protein
MGASISLDSKYRLLLNVEVECISANEPSDKKTKDREPRRDEHRNQDDDSDRSDRSDDSDDSDQSDQSDTDSDSENKTYTVKITPEIAGYIRSYLRKNTFLDEFDLITEIELEKYEHAPGSALVFNSDSVVYITNNQTIESVGEWEYIEPDAPAAVSSSSSSSSSKKHRRRGGDEDDESSGRREYKTKDDSLPVSEIRSILTDKFEEYNKSREFIIHQGKNSFLVLLITSVDIQEV